VIAVGTATWALAAVTAALAVVVLVLVRAWLVGRVTVDLGWGRTRHPLGPVEVPVAAPRDVVFDVVAAPYLGRAPREVRERLEVLERGADLVVAAHHTHVAFFTSTTVESVRFERPARIAFRLLRGISPSVTEEFTLEESPDGTVLRYRGELAMDLWALGWVAGRLLVGPTWERVVRRHLDRVRGTAEARARAGRTGREGERAPRRDEAERPPPLRPP
jgi:hypothetical protein